MYYDATGADYISTPSFAIPNTGILTIEVWMKSKLNATAVQSIIGDSSQSSTVGYMFMFRNANSNYLEYQYANGATVQTPDFFNFFQSLDNQ